MELLNIILGIVAILISLGLYKWFTYAKGGSRYLHLFFSLIMLITGIIILIGTYRDISS